MKADSSPVRLRGLPLLALLALFSVAYAQDSETPRKIVYITPNHSLADLPAWMSRYYRTLKAQDKLPVQVVTDDLGTHVQNLAFGLGVLRGTADKPNFPADMDQLLCSLNTKLCKTDSNGVPRWSNKKGDRICLPDVQWSNGLHFARVDLPNLDELRGRLERKFGTCTALGMRCQSFLESSRNTRSPDGKVLTAVLAQSAHAPDAATPLITKCDKASASAVSDRLQPPLSRLAPEFPRYRAELRAPQASQETLSFDTHIPESAMIEAPVRRSATVAASADAAATASPGPAAVTSAATTATMPVPALADIENDVFKKADLIQFRAPSITPRPVKVLVFDWAVNPCHRVLSRVISLPVPCPSPQPYSAFKLLAAPTDQDHGDHIAALIGGGFGVGVSPTAGLLPVRVLGAEITQMSADVYQSILDPFAELSAVTKVANFSLDLRPEQPALLDKIGELIDGFRTVLFVAAAGDERASLDGPCNVMPACANVPMPEANNLIVVGGATFANGRWTAWTSSRYGRRVDIMAPAEDIESAVYEDGMLGRMTGTSQSAALISGLAARLFQGPPPSVGDWMPSQVKNRLLATARFDSQLLTYTRSGVVDGDRALDTGAQVIVLKDGTLYHGKLIGLTHSDGTQRTSLPFEVSTGHTLDLCRIYRLSHHDGTWTVAYQPAGPAALGRWSYLQLEFGIELHSVQGQLEFRQDGDSAAKTIPVDDVMEFYDKFSEDLACHTVNDT